MHWHRHIIELLMCKPKSMPMVIIMHCTCIAVSDASIERNFSAAQILYNSTDSTLQCKFQGHVYEVVWYLYLTYADLYYIVPVVYAYSFQLGLGNQYHQSTIQGTNLENYYINELTIINRSAPFGPYGCVAITDNLFLDQYSDVISTCKICNCTIDIIIMIVLIQCYSFGFHI